MKETLLKYGRIWLRTASMAMQAQLTYRLGSLGFLVGKTFRLVFFFAFVMAVFRHVKSVAGYSLEETALFFLTYNLVDMSAMILFRGVYGARRTVAEGDFDFYLIQPCSPLFRMVFSTVDFLDLFTIAPVLVLTGMVFAHLPAAPWTAYAAYVLLVGNAVALMLAVHVAVAALAVRTHEMDNAIWVFRNVMFMGRFPADVYARPVRLALTFVLPVAVMTSFPAQAYLGRLSPAWAAYAFILAAAATALSLWFWRDCVSRYTSSSS